jgi:methionine--tRNA ligase beta chain
MDTILFSDFQKVDMRVGTILEASIPEGSQKLIRLVVDCGEELGKRIIFAGVKEFYTPEELIGKQVVAVVNLEPRKFLGEDGQGMLLAADGDRPIFLTPSASVAPGKKIR